MRILIFSMISLQVITQTACISIPTAREAGVNYPTTVMTNTDIDPNAPDSCLNGSNGNTPKVAKEVLVGALKTVVIAGGKNPITDAQWPSYQPSFGNQKNSDRNLLFQKSCFVRSPNVPANCASTNSCASFIELDGHTWLQLSHIVAVDCIGNTQQTQSSTYSCNPAAVKPHELAIVVTEKCHILTFQAGQTAYFLSGPSGEQAIMHATADGIPKTDVPLPTGWKITAEVLDQDLTFYPFGLGDQCFYNIIRDTYSQSYHQIGYAKKGYP